MFSLKTFQDFPGCVYCVYTYISAYLPHICHKGDIWIMYLVQFCHKFKLDLTGNVYTYIYIYTIVFLVCFYDVILCILYAYFIHYICKNTADFFSWQKEFYWASKSPLFSFSSFSMKWRWPFACRVCVCECVCVRCTRLVLYISLHSRVDRRGRKLGFPVLLRMSPAGTGCWYILYRMEIWWSASRSLLALCWQDTQQDVCVHVYVYMKERSVEVACHCENNLSVNYEQ